MEKRLKDIHKQLSEIGRIETYRHHLEEIIEDELDNEIADEIIAIQCVGKVAAV